MALVKCKECGQQVSRKAAACPACGAPVKQSGTGCGWVLVLILTLFAVFMWLPDRDSGVPGQGSTTSAPVDSTGPRRTELDDGKVSVVIGKTANVRRGPGTDYPVVKTLNEGEHYRCFVPKVSDAWVKCFEGQYIHKSLVDFTSKAGPPEPTTAGRSTRSGNPAHDRLLGVSESKRTAVLTMLVLSSNNDCSNVTRTFFQGMNDERAVFWNVACSNGSSYAVMIESDAEGSSKTLDCGVLKLVTGVECFKRF